MTWKSGRHSLVFGCLILVFRCHGLGLVILFWSFMIFRSGMNSGHIGLVLRDLNGIFAAYNFIVESCDVFLKLHSIRHLSRNLVLCLSAYYFILYFL